MPDSRDYRGERDRNRVNINEEYEIRHIADKLGVTTDEVKVAVRVVGDRREDVEDYLRSQGRR